MTATLNAIERKSLEKGLKLTGQRSLIARVLLAVADHPDAEEVFRRGRVVDPSLSLSTVYRSLKLWEDHGIVARHDFGDGRARYEPARDDHHDHLIDTTSGQVIEFADDGLEALQEVIARKLGYRLVGHRLTLYGAPEPE